MGFISTIQKLAKTSKYSAKPLAANQAKQAVQLASRLQDNVQHIRQTFGQSADLILRDFRLGIGEVPLTLLYIDGLAEPKNVLEFLMLRPQEYDLQVAPQQQGDVIRILWNGLLAVGEIREITEFKTLYQDLLSGDSILLIEHCNIALSIGTRKWKDRAVEEPNSQTVVRGPRDGFTETLHKNIALVRRRIKSTDLRIEMSRIGVRTQTDVAVVYIEGIVNAEVLKEVRQRLGRIKIDAILESGYIEELIQDKALTPFPTVNNTERPDALAAGILEGRVAIMVDGTPFSLLVPALFLQFFQASEDYYQRADFATLLRILRFLSFFISMLGPSLYIAITTFHQELLPPELLIRLVAAREGVPFPAFIEALIMEITFEVLREAGVRMPRAIGQAVSIVGTLVIGQAAVEAGIISPSMVIVVSLTAISNFVIPSFNMGIAIRILRFPIMFLAASFGLFGIVISLFAIVLHLCSLRSFGIPYMSPFAPFNWDDQKDSIFRLPQWAQFARPHLIAQNDIVSENTPRPQPEEKS
jgi:spore germination protein KA